MGIPSYSTTASSNNSAPPNGAPEGMAPSAVNDTMRQIMADIRTQHEDAQWIDYGHTPTRIDNDTFTVPGDQTAIYDAGRRVKLVGATTGYATISASAFSAVTTVDVTMDSGNVPASLASVAVGILTGASNAIPTLAAAQIPSLATSKITSGTFADARIAASNVTQHQAALAIDTDQLTTDYTNADTSTSFTVGDGHAESIRRFTSSSAITVTLPNSIPTNWAVGDSMVFIRGGTGTVTFSSAGTIRSPGTSTITAQNGKVCATLAAAGEWELSGNV
jgi:hypothetical protein